MFDKHKNNIIVLLTLSKSKNCNFADFGQVKKYCHFATLGKPKNIVILLTLGKLKNIVILLTLGKSKVTWMAFNL